MKILITGIGITGKSTFRRMLKKIFPWIVDIDGDYEKMPKSFDENQTYIIEDVHALTDEACLSLDDYNLVIYLLPDLFTHTLFWFKRVWRWFENGEGSWDKKRQDWLGSGEKYDLGNIPLFLKLMIRNLSKRRQWINQDVDALFEFKKKTVLIPVRLNQKGIQFIIPAKFKPFN